MLRIFGWVWPLAALPLFFWLILSSVLNFGGDEKDIIMIVPAAFYALLYWVAYFIFLRRNVTAGRAILFALAAAFVAVLLIGFAFSSFLGIRT